MFDYPKCLLENIPSSLYYIQNFISKEEEAHIIKNVYSVPKPKWTCLSNRRLQDYGGIPHEKGMIPEKIPDWLQKYINKVNDLNIFDGKVPNHVLINEYLPGQGIMPHTDGPLFYPKITTITCGSNTVLKFLENNEKRGTVAQVLLERCSLVVVEDDLYEKYLHSIEEKEFDSIEECANLKSIDNNIPLKRDTRISLTIRHVPKVLKIKLFK
ncbi:unnamed protein product [Brassicogethes aeneus]|uniref:Fe2OG dioxygenase domain-containing protein n=1 Tax=Brassicogethes aeneus TaxID=1431903 RepID=A0A9P0B2Q5_BRAAE|nr:unnamed protein product [Brassicogethes aeneus]